MEHIILCSTPYFLKLFLPLGFLLKELILLQFKDMPYCFPSQFEADLMISRRVYIFKGLIEPFSNNIVLNTWTCCSSCTYLQCCVSLLHFICLPPWFYTSTLCICSQFSFYTAILSLPLSSSTLFESYSAWCAQGLPICSSRIKQSLYGRHTYFYQDNVFGAIKGLCY